MMIVFMTWGCYCDDYDDDDIILIMMKMTKEMQHRRPKSTLHDYCYDDDDNDDVIMTMIMTMTTTDHNLEGQRAHQLYQAFR